jgi:hypothetical protein
VARGVPVMSMAFSSTANKVAKAAPVEPRQSVQWQFTARRISASALKLIFSHRHFPESFGIFWS